jgi:hypothetical protein
MKTNDMKNIHVLQTDKSSEFYSIDGKHKLANSTMAMDWYISSVGYKPHNIYITSDEEIKEGDWVVTPNKNIMLVITKYATESSFMIGNSKHKGSPYYIEFCRKIILTTDQDLIADGVQAIDDEFLNWFVKNPTCEFIHTYNDRVVGYEYDNYTIVIPHEGIDEYLLPKFSEEEPKQETLEEAAERYARKQCDDMYDNEGLTGASWGWETSLDFIAGAKWQQEQDKKLYSEEEVLNIIVDCDGSLTQAKKWFKQFKKK